MKPITDQQVEMQIAMENARAAADERRQKAMDKVLKQKYDNPVVPVYQSLVPLTDKAVEQESSPELVKPGDYCYRKIASAYFQNGHTTFKKRVIINCPFCNKAQILTGHEYDYQLDNSLKTKLKVLANKITERLWKTEPFNFMGQGLLTIKDNITCQFNILHQYSIIKNEIKPIQNKNASTKMDTKPST